ncbi:MAG: zinc ribbon domain-containing protein [Planctomycetota bacterium]
MPTYDYHCDANGQTVEAFHTVSKTISTWGELCECAEIDPGETSPDTPVARILGAGLAPARSSSSSSGSAAAPRPTGGGGGCGGGCACH